MFKGIKKININYDINSNIEVEYKFIESNIGNNIIYGFSIKSKIIGTKEITKKEFLDFTDNFEYAKNIFNSLIQNKVLPLNLINVLDDITN
ncbi:DUF6514 family protein [uncultured Tyzzerella sp.]|uniref:DUF6514 family protein n=1 Tax=uncultured Tyzzerella sp. TaxID=2321398 RepID=UPI00294285F0|nr:DUF6514 family protein [uncultured Tyzzerella sp.]